MDFRICFSFEVQPLLFKVANRCEETHADDCGFNTETRLIQFKFL